MAVSPSAPLSDANRNHRLSLESRAVREILTWEPGSRSIVLEFKVKRSLDGSDYADRAHMFHSHFPGKLQNSHVPYSLNIK